MSDIKQFDIYWVAFDPTLGSEIQKTRPAIVVSPMPMNKVVKTLIVVPLTKTVIDWPFRTKILSSGKLSSAACDQIRSVATKRLQGKIGSLNLGEQQAVLQILQQIFAE